jgi:hypothetical protein
MNEREIRMIDIDQVKHGVEISIRESVSGGGNMFDVWINIDGLCRLRCTRVTGDLIDMDISPKLK